MMTAFTQSSPTGSAAPISEIDVELFTFIERYATNLVRWDLLLFFGGHPDSRITAAELAQQTKRALKATTKELEDLTYLRVLARRYTPGRVTYQLARNGPVRQAVRRLAAYAGKGK
ncbi:MAG: hypothetical protein WCF84_25640 [Anaerolineae bacterium]